MKRKLYHYAALYHDKDKTESALEPAYLLAKDEEHAKKLVIKLLDSEYDDKLADIEVLVRPF